MATLNKNRLGKKFVSVSLHFCLNKKLTGDARALLNNEDAEKGPHVWGGGYVYRAADKAGLYTLMCLVPGSSLLVLSRLRDAPGKILLP